MLKSFLLIGQSNMAGRGFVADVPVLVNDNIKVLRNGRWQMMFEPIHHDRSTAGIGLGSSFASAWQMEHKDAQIGLIPCADGGTSLDDWSVEGPLFAHAVAQAKLAMRSSELIGILWHQGENDCAPQNASQYGEKLTSFLKELRVQLDAPRVPIIVGGLGDFLPNGMYGSYFSDYPIVNDALLNYVQTHDYCYFVSANGLTANADQIHFDAQSQRIFGIRYYEAFSKQRNVVKPLEDEQQKVSQLYDRPILLQEKQFILQHQFGIGEISLADFLAQMEKLKQ